MTRTRKSPTGWAVKAVRVGEQITNAQLHPAVLAWAGRRRLGDVWCVAFSGGADSLALLLLLWAHWPKRRAKLLALHFNHRLRGRESVAEEKFCRQVCSTLGIRLQVGQWRGTRTQASEAEARSKRHGFFTAAMKRAGSKVLWLAHQQDDIAESMLMRLARGSGAGGLAAPRPVQPASAGRVHLRPLLTVKKAALQTVLRKAGADWCEDSSNASDDHFRNRIRRKVVPGWIKASGRDALAGAALARELLEEDDDALEAWAETLAKPGRGRWLNVADLVNVPRAVVRRALHHWLGKVRPQADLTRQGFTALLAAVVRGRPTRFSLGVRGFAVIKRGKLVFKKG